jgi:histidine triad (HIT) family protein
MNENEASALFSAVNIVAKVVERTLRIEGMNIGINNGEIAGQTVPHVHVHIIPRRENDNGGSMHTIVETKPNRDKLAELAKHISNSF